MSSKATTKSHVGGSKIGEVAVLVRRKIPTFMFWTFTRLTKWAHPVHVCKLRRSCLWVCFGDLAEVAMALQCAHAHTPESQGSVSVQRQLHGVGRLSILYHLLSGSLLVPLQLKPVSCWTMPSLKANCWPQTVTAPVDGLLVLQLLEAQEMCQEKGRTVSRETSLLEKLCLSDGQRDSSRVVKHRTGNNVPYSVCSSA